MIILNIKTMMHTMESECFFKANRPKNFPTCHALFQTILQTQELLPLYVKKKNLTYIDSI